MGKETCKIRIFQYTIIGVESYVTFLYILLILLKVHQDVC